MNTNENNYRIEEMEDRAVNKSNLLKTGAVAGAMGIVGAGVAVAANHVLSDDGETAETNEISEESLLNAATNGAEETQVVVEAEEHHHHHHHEEPAPEPASAPEPEPEMTVDEQVVVVDSDGNYVASQTSGTLEGKAYVVQDTNGDGNVNRIYYDANGNQQFETDEVADITGDDLKMSDFGQATHTTVHHLGEDYNDPGYGDGGDVSNDLGDDEIAFNEDEELPVADDAMEEPAEEPAEEPVAEPVEEPIEEPTPDDFADASDDFTNDADVYDFA